MKNKKLTADAPLPTGDGQHQCVIRDEDNKIVARAVGATAQAAESNARLLANNPAYIDRIRPAKT